MFKSRRKEESSNTIANLKMNQEQEEIAKLSEGEGQPSFICFDRSGRSQASAREEKGGGNRASFSEAERVNQILIFLIGVQEQGVEQVFKGKGQPNFNCFDRCARAGS